MKNEAGSFIPAARVGIHDAEQRAAVAFGAASGFGKRQAAMFAAGEAHGQALRHQAAAIRRHALNHLPELLEQAEAHMPPNGIEVLWADDGDEAHRPGVDVARRPGARTEDTPQGEPGRRARFAADRTRLAGSLQAQLAQVHAGEVDVLVGTQMVAKGHDFRRITLVAAVNADNALFSSDFRAPERLFSLLMQAAGRAGRDAAILSLIHI